MRRFPWASLGFAALVAGASALPSSWLEYAPGRFAWTALTAQLTHWSVAMTVANVAVLAGLGAWLERHSGRVWLGSVVFGALAVAAWLLLLAREPYRGASGIATALFASTAVVVWPRSRALVAWALLLFGAKLAWEATGHAATPGAVSLPGGVRVAWEAHLAGALGGLVAARMARPGGTRCDADSSP